MAQVGKIPEVSLSGFLPRELVAWYDAAEFLVDLNAIAGVQFCHERGERCVDSFPARDIATPSVLVYNEEHGHVVGLSLRELLVLLLNGHPYFGDLVRQTVERFFQGISYCSNSVTELVGP